MATLERWRAEALGTARTERIWTATARLEAVIATAALDETARSAWCREQGLYRSDLEAWRDQAIAAGPPQMRPGPRLEVLTEIGQGNAVSIILIYAELTTRKAADILNISRSLLVQLLERGDMPFHEIGTHRRVRYQDVIDYKNRIDAERRKALDELAAQAQELGMGY